MARLRSGIASLTVLLLAASHPAAQQETAATSPPPTDPGDAPHCFAPRPLPRCGDFWITEFGPLFFLTPSPGDPHDGRTMLITWELGYMSNRTPTRAVGGNVFLAANDNQFRLGVRGRYRLWREAGTALEIGPGLIVLRSDTDLEITGAPGLAAQVGLTWRDWLTAIGQAELTGDGVNLQLGGRAGSYSGAVASVGLPLLVILLMGSDSS